MIDAKLIKSERTVGGKYGDRECFYSRLAFAVPNVAKSSTSPIIRFRTGENISIDFIRTFSESLKYTLELYDNKSVYGLSKLLIKEDINKFSAFNDYEQNGSLIVINTDQPKEPFVYGIITNNDSVNDTSIIQVEFLIASV